MNPEFAEKITPEVIDNIAHERAELRRQMECRVLELEQRALSQAPEAQKQDAPAPAERGRRGIGLRPGMLQRTLRQAIDDAMKETTHG